jgi:hypothetical protein
LTGGAPKAVAAASKNRVRMNIIILQRKNLDPNVDGGHAA